MVCCLLGLRSKIFPPLCLLFLPPLLHFSSISWHPIIDPSLLYLLPQSPSPYPNPFFQYTHFYPDMWYTGTRIGNFLHFSPPTTFPPLLLHLLAPTYRPIPPLSTPTIPISLSRSILPIHPLLSRHVVGGTYMNWKMNTHRYISSSLFLSKVN